MEQWKNIKEIVIKKVRTFCSFKVCIVIAVLVLAGLNTYNGFCSNEINYYKERDIKVLSLEKGHLNQSCIPEEAKNYLSSEKELTAPEVTAKAAALIDADSGRLLYGKDSDTRYPMASTTKIMTLLYTLETSNLSDVVTVSKRAAGQPKVRLGMREGQKFRLEDLLYGLMLESYNDCAVAIAEHVSGSVEQFCQEMTLKARNMGLKDTQFITPNGLDAEGHYTTAYEIARIGAAALNNKEAVKIINTRSHAFTDMEGKSHYNANNKNAFLTMYNGAIGIKTGYTSKASYCFVGAVKREGRVFVSSVLSSGNYPNKTVKWKDTRELMDYGVENYKKVCILQPSMLFNKVPVENGIRKSVLLYEDQSCTTLLREGDQLTYQVSFPKKGLAAPIEEEQCAGYLTIFINEKEYQKVPLLTLESSEKWNYKWCLIKTLQRYLYCAPECREDVQ